MPLVEQTCVLFMKMDGRPYNHDSLSSAAWLKSQNTARFSAPGAQTLRALEPQGFGMCALETEEGATYRTPYAPRKEPSQTTP